MIGTYGAVPGSVPGAIASGVKALEGQYSADQLAELTTVGVNVAKELTSTPYQRLELAKAGLQAAVVEGRPYRVILEAQAKVVAAEQSVRDYEMTQASRWEWATLGKIGVSVAIGIGIAVLFNQIRR